MPMKLNENNYSYYIYRNLICLAILLHFGYTLPMGILHYGVPLLYNICSVLFYIGMLLLVMKKKAICAGRFPDSFGNHLLCCVTHCAVWLERFLLSLSDRNGFSCVFLSLPQSLHPLSVFLSAYAHLFSIA